MPISTTTALLFARCVGFIVRAPGFSHQGVPVAVRVALAFMLAYALTPLAQGHVHLQNGSLVLGLVTELLIGVAIGLAASAIYEGASAGGKLLDSYVGIQSINPTADVAAGDGFSSLWGVIFIAAFFFFNGYRWLIGAFANSIRGLPPGSLVQLHDLQTLAIVTPSVVMKVAVLIAGPALAIGLVAQVGIGAISRIIPRFSNFSLTFPVVFGLVLLVSLASIPIVLATAHDMIAHPLPMLPFLRK